MYISEDERRALARALDGYLPELAAEAARTDRQADAHELWNLYRALQAVRARLDSGAEASAAAGHP